VKIRNTILGAGLWVVAAGASALSLGASRGTVVLGQMLDLTFEVKPDEGSDTATSCVVVAVKSGDSPVSEAKVQVTPVPAGVRVQAFSVIDEPVVQVTLSAGCAGRTTRTYTFLADPPKAAQRVPAGTALGASGNAGAGAAMAGLSASRSGLSPEAATVARLPDVDSEAVAPPAGRARPKPPYRDAPVVRKEPRAPSATPSAKASAAPAAQAASGRDAARSRLVMEPLDTWLDLPVALRATPELPQAPASDTTPQREQAAALWRTLNLDPQTLAQEQESQRKLELEVTQLRARATRDQAASAELQRQLQEMDAERFQPWVVYALGAALAAALGLGAWLWRRSDRSATKKAARSWRESVVVSRKADGKDIVDLDPLEQVPMHPADRWGRPMPSGSGASAAPHPAHAATPVDIVLETDEVSLEEAGFARPAAPQTEPVLQHIVNPEELFDIQQQAEFFVSVGEHDQAVQVLRQHIADHEQTSPVAYLELLRLYRTLSRAADFNVLRQQFMRHFNAQVPEFSAFDRLGKSLDQYPEALAEIEAEWSVASVLHVLEKHMFYRSGDARKAPFDLAAFDDLLLLLAIAQTTPASARGAPPPRKRTTPKPQSFEAAAAHALSSLTPLGPMDTTPDFPLDSLAAALEFGFEPAPAAADATLETQPTGLAPTQRMVSADEFVDSVPVPAPASSRAAAASAASTFTLDIDVSEPVPITISDLPPVPVTPPPPPGQPVGFGSTNDMMELSLELEPIKPEDKK
jgi:pilus assembly protein FimV